MKWLALAVVLSLAAVPAEAQPWRESAARLGGATARVLLIGTRPEDEDNALIAWLSLGRHVETAYLSLTRGESGKNLIGTGERQATLAVVRTAELLAERQQDGARQYFRLNLLTGRQEPLEFADLPQESPLRSGAN